MGPGYVCCLRNGSLGILLFSLISALTSSPMLPILHCCLALSLLLSPKFFQWFASFCLMESYITLPDGHPRVRKSLTHSSIVTCPLHSTHYTRTQYTWNLMTMLFFCLSTSNCCSNSSSFITVWQYFSVRALQTTKRDSLTILFKVLKEQS